MRLYTKNANNVFKGWLGSTTVLCITPVVSKIEANRSKALAGKAVGIGRSGGKKPG